MEKTKKTSFMPKPGTAAYAAFKMAAIDNKEKFYQQEKAKKIEKISSIMKDIDQFLSTQK